VRLDDLLGVFRDRLYLPDPSPVVVVVAAVVANLLTGDPVWLLLVGPPSSGKTEILTALSKLVWVHEVSTFTEAGLLSGSMSRDPSSTGGLLVELGRFGIIVCKDFTSLLSEAPDKRSGLLAALREIYDGGWVRRLGTSGGRTLGWAGKAGLLAGVTETVDRHAAFMGAMGERFVLFRMAALDDEDRLAQARAALANAGRQAEMRAAFADAVAGFFADLDIPTTAPPLDEETTERLALLADLATRLRSAVERDPRDREVELVPQPEAPGRLQAVLAQLLRGLIVIGVPEDEAGSLVTRVGLDSMPKSRRVVVELLVSIKSHVLFDTAGVGDVVGLPTSATGRVLADLSAHRVVERYSDNAGGRHRWVASEWLRERWADLELPIRPPMHKQLPAVDDLGAGGFDDEELFNDLLADGLEGRP